MKKKELEREYESLSKAHSYALKRIASLEKMVEMWKNLHGGVEKVYWEEEKSKRRWRRAFWICFLFACLFAYLYATT